MFSLVFKTSFHSLLPPFPLITLLQTKKLCINKHVCCFCFSLKYIETCTNNAKFHVLSSRYINLRNFNMFRCDRVLWHGGGLRQLSYVRGESRFSDHRPVYSMFWAEVESYKGRLRKSMSYSSSRIQVEELLPYSQGYTELCFF